MRMLGRKSPPEGHGRKRSPVGVEKGELCNEVRDIVQETGIKTIPMEKKCKKAKWLPGEALQIAVKNRLVPNRKRSMSRLYIVPLLIYKLESRLPGEISVTSEMQMTPPLCQKAKKH